jgi:TonB family protein
MDVDGKGRAATPVTAATPCLLALALLAGCAGPIVRSVRSTAPVAMATPPRVVARALADYPAGLAKLPARDIEVVMNVGVDAAGVVRTVVVTQSGGSAFDQAARGALYKTRFSPGRRDDGRAVDSVIEYRYLFKAQDPVGKAPRSGK